MGGTITRIDLKRAIILEDARRLKEGKKPINNINRLADELVDKRPKRYKVGTINKWLYRANGKGITLVGRTYVMDEILQDLCEILNTTKDELIIVMET